MDYFLSILRTFEYGRADTGENYLRVEYGYYPNQFYISGFKNSFYFSVLFSYTNKSISVLQVLSGLNTFVPFESTQVLDLSSFFSWFSTVTSVKNVERLISIFSKYMNKIGT